MADIHKPTPAKVSNLGKALEQFHDDLEEVLDAEFGDLPKTLRERVVQRLRTSTPDSAPERPTAVIHSVFTEEAA
jgi:hypothetical protein